MFSCVRRSVTKCPFWSWMVTRCLCSGFTPTESYWGRRPVRTLLGTCLCGVTSTRGHASAAVSPAWLTQLFLALLITRFLGFQQTRSFSTVNTEEERFG